MNAHKVLCAKPLAGSEAYRHRVAEMLADIIRDTRSTLVDIAEEIEVSVGTISNAMNCKGDLSGVYLLRIGQRFGATYLNPVMGVIDAEVAPRQPQPKRDIMPILTRTTLKIAEARDPAGPGGSVEVPQERKGYLPCLKEAQREIGCLIKEIEAF